MPNIRQFLTPPGPFWQFDREERNAVARLLVLLAEPANLRVLTDACGWEVPDLTAAEVGVEWTYVRDLWRHHAGSGPEVLRDAILRTLAPAAEADLSRSSVLDFNTHFGAVPAPSATFIQSPSNWSIARFDTNIPDNDEFRRTCVFKWAFNVKPDLVVQVGEKVLCIEAKWDSGEGQYPGTDREKAIFSRRGLPYVPQTEVQKYLVNDLLGFEGTFAYLTKVPTSSTTARSITWRDLLGRMTDAHCPAALQAWRQSLLTS